MGFSLTAFAGGFASALSEDIEKEEKLAQVRAANGVKTMAETYKTVLAENRKTKGELVENINALRTYDPTASEAELFEIAKNKPLMELVAAKVKSGDFSTDTLKLSNFATIPATNTTATALERAEEMFKIPTAAAASKEQEVARTGNLIRDITSSAGGRAGERAARETAAALGIPLEQLQSVQGYTTPSLTSAATAKMDAFKKAKTFDQQVDDAKSRLAAAELANNDSEIRLAKADLLVFKSVADNMTEPQKQFANKIADIKNRYMFGTPEERKAAKPEYDQLMSDIRAEAAAKKTGEGKEDKIPPMSTLNTFTGGAVARAVAAKHGDLIKSKQLAIVEKADGSMGIDYIGDNEALRRQILETQATAARNALSLYTDAEGKPFNRDVQSILNSYVSVVPSVVRTDGAALPAAAGPQATTKPALPAPTSNSVTVNGKVYARPANFTDQQWNEYKKSVGVTK